MEPLKLEVPEIGRWYRTPANEVFSVVAIEEGAGEGGGTIEIQYFDGTLEELDHAEWGTLLAQAVPEPEDSSGALDMHVDADPDAGVDEPDADTWVDPLNLVDRL